VDQTRRRRRLRLACLLPSLVLVAVLGSGGGSLAGRSGDLDAPVVDLHVTTAH
jgi:hypothetical protein